mmetsp:Transcript_45821/g.111736  ORF Transcript_45821/g.111736 Transcript_45821/m.111736 type:complete len:225 (+) Transcript_45821:200-874(+)
MTSSVVPPPEGDTVAAAAAPSRINLIFSRRLELPVDGGVLSPIPPPASFGGMGVFGYTFFASLPLAPVAAVFAGGDENDSDGRGGPVFAAVVLEDWIRCGDFLLSIAATLVGEPGGPFFSKDIRTRSAVRENGRFLDGVVVGRGCAGGKDPAGGGGPFGRRGGADLDRGATAPWGLLTSRFACAAAAAFSRAVDANTEGGEGLGGADPSLEYSNLRCTGGVSDP